MTKQEKTDIAEEMAKNMMQIKKFAWNHNNTCGDLRQSEFMFLITLANFFDSESNGIKVSDLSTKLQITPAAATHMINSLEKEGYLNRTSTVEDRRVVLLSPTPKGMDYVQKRKSEFLETLNGLIDFIGEQDSREFIRILSLTFNYLKDKRMNEK